jgi:hypothetical protein
VGGGDTSGDMRFHVGGMGAGFAMQGALFRRARHRSVDSDDVGDHRAAERAGKPLRPNRIAAIARAGLGDDRAGDKLGPRSKSRRQAAREAKTDDRRCLVGNGRLQGKRETRGVAGAREGKDSRPGGNSCFRLEASNGDDWRAVYIPMRTGCGPPSFRLR